MHMTRHPRRSVRLRSITITVFTIALLAPLGAAPAPSFVWKATGTNGASVYLAGSIHMLTPDAYPLSAAFERAYTESDVLVEEVDIAEMTGTEVQMKTLMRGMLPPGQTLDKVLAPATVTLLNKAATDVGAPMEALQRLKPWMIALTLEGLELQKAGFNPELGLDMHFYNLAKKGGKTVQGLETVEYQISRFDEMTYEQQDRMLAESLKEMGTEKANVTKLTDAWKSGNAAAVERIVLGDLKADPFLYQRLLVERNKNWLPKIEAFFTNKTRALVLVGAAHLVGPDGLVAMLRAKGYKVEQQ
jgi:uncharacterized protein YbaP (TraB family)